MPTLNAQCKRHANCASADCTPRVKIMRTGDPRIFNSIVLPFPSMKTTRNCGKQANPNVIQAGLRGIQVYRSADFHYDYPEYHCLQLALRFSASVQSAFYPWSTACILPSCYSNAPIIGHPLGGTLGKGGDFVQDPMVGEMVQNSQSLYSFTFNALIVIHEYIYSHSTKIFIHMYRCISYSRLFLLTFTRCLYSHLTCYIQSHSWSKHSFSIFCAPPLCIIRS